MSKILVVLLMIKVYAWISVFGYFGIYYIESFYSVPVWPQIAIIIWDFHFIYGSFMSH